MFFFLLLTYKQKSQVWHITETLCLGQKSVGKEGFEIIQPRALHKSSHRGPVDKCAFSHVSTVGRKRKTETDTSYSANRE